MIASLPSCLVNDMIIYTLSRVIKSSCSPYQIQHLMTQTRQKTDLVVSSSDVRFKVLNGACHWEIGQVSVFISVKICDTLDIKKLSAPHYTHIPSEWETGPQLFCYVESFFVITLV